MLVVAVDARLPFHHRIAPAVDGREWDANRNAIAFLYGLLDRVEILSEDTFVEARRPCVLGPADHG